VIAGQVYGGVEDSNDMWQSPKVWNIYAVYTGVAPVGNTFDDATSTTTDVVLYVFDNTQLFEYNGRTGADSSSNTLIIKLDERTNLDPRAAEQYTVTGYLALSGETRFGGAWLALLDCEQGVDEPEVPTKNWCCDYPRQGIQRECLQSFVDPSDGQTIVCQQVETCDECVPYTECTTDDECDPCGVCSEQGMCLIDDTQRDECGKCPGQSGFGECKIIGCSAAFGDCVTANGINVPEALDDIEARIQALETPPSPPPTENL